MFSEISVGSKFKKYDSFDDKIYHKLSKNEFVNMPENNYTCPKSSIVSRDFMVEIIK